MAALINIDSESYWTRSQIYHSLLKKYYQNNASDLEVVSFEELQERRAYYIQQLETAPPFTHKELKKKIDEIEQQLSGNNAVSRTNSRSSWNEIIQQIQLTSEFKTLFKKSGQGNNVATQANAYAQSLMLDQLLKRIPRERSLENLGLVNIVYPSLEAVPIPMSANILNITQQEWDDLLKIAADYILRYSNHVSYSYEVAIFSTKYYRQFKIYPSDNELDKVRKWPKYILNRVIQHRFVLLICAGLGWTDYNTIGPNEKDKLNELLNDIWNTLRAKILTADEDGYRLDLLAKSKLELASKCFLCPATQRLIDRTFRGYSPWIKGRLEALNVANYKIKKTNSIELPIYPYAFNRNEENLLVDDSVVNNWLDTNSISSREVAIWNNLHELIFRPNHLFLAGEHSAQQAKGRLSELEREFESGEINILSSSTTMEMGVDIGGISAVVMSNVPPMPANYLQRTGRAGRRSENKSLALTFCAPNAIGARTMNNPSWAFDHPIASPHLLFDSEIIVKRHINAFFLSKFLSSNERAGMNIKENIENFFFNTEDSFAHKYSNWLKQINIVAYENALKFIIKSTTIELEKPENIKNRALVALETLCNNASEELKNIVNRLSELENKLGDNSPAYKALKYRKLQFLQKHILNYMSEMGYLPNSGLPTGIVEFDNTTLDDINRGIKSNNVKESPSYPIDRALLEFAPGNHILIDGKSYTSSGIILKTKYGSATTKNVVQACSKCGYQRMIESNDDFSVCPICGMANAFVGISMSNVQNAFTEVIEPAGFAIDIFDHPSRVVSEKSKPQYLEPLFLNLPVWDQRQDKAISIRSSTQSDTAKLLYYNNGLGNGYSVCLECGRVANENADLVTHRRLRGGKSNNENHQEYCTGLIKDHVIIGATVNTDFTEIRLLNSDKDFVNDKILLYTLGDLFSKVLCEILAIDDAEIGFGVKNYKVYQTLFLFDTAKGGAGYASQFSLHVDNIIAHALEKLNQCSCTNGCTKCLIDRSTQWHLELINKKSAIEWLTFATNIQIPQSLIKAFPKAKAVLGNIDSELRNIDFKTDIKAISFFVNSDVSTWDVSSLDWIWKWKVKGVTLNIVMTNPPENMSMQEQMSLHKLSKLVDFKLEIGETKIEYQKNYAIELANGNTYTYVSKLELEPFHNFLEKDDQTLYRYILEKSPIYLNYKIPSFDIHVVESHIGWMSTSINSDQIATQVLLNIDNGSKNLVMEKFRNKTFEVDYYDKYNLSEFSMQLLLQYIDQWKIHTNSTITALRIHLTDKAFSKNYNRDTQKIADNFGSIEAYEKHLKNLAEDYAYPITLVHSYKLPHYRFFSFQEENSKSKIEIRIDGGIAHGFIPNEDLYNNDLKKVEPFKIKKIVAHDLIYYFSF